jgi:hypothetical protein
MIWTRIFQIAIIAGATGIAVGLVPPTYACTCSDSLTFEEAKQQSVAIFSGVVVGIRTGPPQLFNAVWVDFMAGAYWKGIHNADPSLITPANEGLCGFPFEVGAEYLVYAGEEPTEGFLIVNLCGRTHETGPDDPDLELLGPPMVVQVAPATRGRVKQMYR